MYLDDFHNLVVSDRLSRITNIFLTNGAYDLIKPTLDNLTHDKPRFNQMPWCSCNKNKIEGDISCI